MSSSGDYRPLAIVPTGIVAPFPALAERATLGHMLVAFDVDGAPRYDYPALAHDVEFYPSMAAAARPALPRRGWKDVGLELGRGVSLGRVFVPTDPQMRLLVDYLGPPGAFQTYSLSQVLAGGVPMSTFRDRIVLVGANATGAGDTFESPFTNVMSGVERLATVVDSMLHERHLRRSGGAPWIEGVALLAAALVLGLAVSRLSLALPASSSRWLWSRPSSDRRRSRWRATASGRQARCRSLAIVADVHRAVALSLRAARQGTPAHPPGVFALPLAADGRSPGARPTPPQLGGELRELTVLFCDLRGFTALSERLEPATLTARRQRVPAGGDRSGAGIRRHRRQVHRRRDHGVLERAARPAGPRRARVPGRVADPERLEASTRRAGRCAGLPTLEAGIGINTGPCTVGNFGSTHRFDYSAIGRCGEYRGAPRRRDEESRLRNPARAGDARQRVPDFATIPLERIQLRGRVESLEVFALVGAGNAGEAATRPSPDPPSR